jgi:hypothetical protein
MTVIMLYHLAQNTLVLFSMIEMQLENSPICRGVALLAINPDQQTVTDIRIHFQHKMSIWFQDLTK